ncbi:MAG: hypothetical protein PVSMB8_07460 [Vulcanimicrobiaceae bacterium]
MRDWRKRESEPPKSDRTTAQRRRDYDLKLLRQLLDHDHETLDRELESGDTVREVFACILAEMTDYTANVAKRHSMSDKQRAWAENLLAEIKPTENLVSRGLVPRGREVETIAALKPENLPRKPPGRTT